MNAPTSTCSWRDSAVIPAHYESVASVVAAARKARGRSVNFDWHLATDDLRKLRRGVYEWGRRSVGRYKSFDARVLHAINGALNDGDTTFGLRDPNSDLLTNCAVSCVVNVDTSSLVGHAPFDVVFAYGMAGLDPAVVGHAHLGASVQALLVDSVRMLGWDLDRLRDPQLQPVRNVLYGLSPGYRISGPGPDAGPSTEINVSFQGPFSAIPDSGDRCLFTDDIASRSGVYLWTIPVDGQQRVLYVGQTLVGFGKRTRQHLAGFLSGEYTTWDLAALRAGTLRRAEGAGSFLQDFETLAPHVIGVIRLMRFHCAPLEGDRHLHNRVETAVGNSFRTHAEPALRDLLWPGLKLPAVVPYDTPLRLVLSSEVPIAGLPTHLEI